MNAFQSWTIVCLLLGLFLLSPATPTNAASNLLTNAGFENGSSSWNLCGSAQIVETGNPGVAAAMVYAGRRAVRLTFTENNKCGSPVFDPDGAAVQQLGIPANAPAVTISFWYSRIGNPGWPIKVSLAEPDGFGYLTQVDVENLPGWHLFRYELTTQQLERVRGKNVVLELASEYDALGSDLPQTENPGFYLDEVRLVAASERTTESPRPSDFPSDNKGPIVYLDAALGGIARMNANGSGARKIYSATTTPASPAWSSRGDRVAVVEGWLNPENNVDVKVNPAFISKIIVFSAGGTGAREILRTAGLPGYRPTVPSPGDPERPALDVEASYITWSPDDRTLAISLCARNRTKNGSTSDPICWVELFDVATGASRGKFDSAFAPRWNGNNKIIYSNEDSYSAKAQGIYEVDMNINPPSERLIVPGTGEQFEPSFYTDRSPAWSPDGSKFATVRKVDGYHYEGEQFIVHYGIMVFNRNELIGRQVLLVDHGSEPSDLTWSPDGNFMLYTLYRGNSADIWWLDIRSGATGKLTANGAGVAASWRLRCPNPACSDTSSVFIPLARRSK